MKALNVHQRFIPAPLERVGGLLDSLASRQDRLWPHESWPPMKLDGPLGIGARGGHGPIRYTVEAYEPGRRVVFRFTGPRGFDGTHRYEIEDRPGGSLLRHVIEMRTRGPALFTWPILFRPLHDALMEDSLSKAEESFAGAGGTHGTGARPGWSWYVRGLRWGFRLLRRRRRRA